eukprot:5384603-Lingulodinium_polyedra.AAC.1
MVNVLHRCPDSDPTTIGEPGETPTVEQQPTHGLKHGGTLRLCLGPRYLQDTVLEYDATLHKQ